MIGLNTNKFAKEHNLKQALGMAMGTYRGYFINLEDLVSGKRLFIAAHLKDNDALVNNIKLKAAIIAKSFLDTIMYDDHYVEIYFKEGLALGKKIYEVLDATIDILVENNIKGEGICTFCGENLDLRDNGMSKIGNAAMPSHNDCIESYNKRIGEIKVAVAEDDIANNRTLLKGFLGSLIGAVVGAIPWVIIYMLGFVSAWGAVLVGIGANYGYKKFNGKNDKLKIFIIIIATVIGLVIGMFSSFCVSIYMFSEIPNITLMDTPYIFFEALRTIPEYKSAIISDTIMSFIFGGLGIIGYYSYIKKKEKMSGINEAKRLS